MALNREIGGQCSATRTIEAGTLAQLADEWQIGRQAIGLVFCSAGKEASMKRRLIDFLLWVDYQTDGIRLRLFVAAAVLQVFLAPLWDQYLPYQRVAAKMEPMTFVATILFMGLSLTLVGGAAHRAVLR